MVTTGDSKPVRWPDHIRDERAGDEASIAEVTAAAFAGAEHSDGTEPAIVERLRADRALALSLVAEDAGGRIVGHAAFSPVTIDGAECGWFGLGPVSVHPGCQRSGVGSALIEEGIARLRAASAAGCVVLGDPGYYRRFGFHPDSAVRFPGPPPEYFQCLVLAGPAVEGTVSYADAFGG